MQNEIKTKSLCSYAIKILLTFCVSVMCAFGMSSLYQSMAVKSLNIQYGCEQDVGTTKYFSVSYTPSDESAKTKYLKVVKGERGALTVYSANTLADAIKPSAEPSSVLEGSYSFASPMETWNIKIKDSVAGDDKVANLKDLECQSWGDLPAAAGLPAGAVSYYQVQCKKTDGYDIKYLKVVKGAAEGVLTVYSANTLADAKGSSASVDNHFVGRYVVTGVAPYTETWYIALNPDNTDYSDIVSLNTLTTEIKDNKVWDGTDDQKKVDVAIDTIVQFKLTGTSSDGGVESKVFYVKKVAVGSGTTAKKKLQLSINAYQADAYSDALVDSDGHTINAYLKPAVNDDDAAIHEAEEWIITITGYEFEVDGKIKTYRILEEKMIAYTQQWIKKDDAVVNTFNGEKQMAPSYSIVRTLQLNGVPKVDNPKAGPFNIVRLTRHVTDGAVDMITVEGLKGKISNADDATEVTFATVIDATNEARTKRVKPVDGILTFNNTNSEISVNEIKAGANVTVNIRMGVDNAFFSLLLRTDANGLFFSEFEVPIDSYDVDSSDEGEKDVIEVTGPYLVPETKI